MLEVRPARKADLPAIKAVLARTWHDTYDALFGRERVLELTSSWHALERLQAELDDPTRTLLVAERDGEIVGTASGHRDAQGVFVVARLYVVPDRQRAGAGGRLLRALLQDVDAELVRLEVEPRNAKAIAFYESNGFAVVERGPDCGEHGSGIEHLVMERRLRPR